ncbi:hypothetical protein [Sphingomonas sp. Leaf21]|uniref:hypothetical protein n=1 Tax=Sphingomonas sp. Leaf21 TaxID=2876550 RepID=UPI003FA7CC69
MPMRASGHCDPPDDLAAERQPPKVQEARRALEIGQRGRIDPAEPVELVTAGDLAPDGVVQCVGGDLGSAAFRRLDVCMDDCIGFGPIRGSG